MGWDSCGWDLVSALLGNVEQLDNIVAGEILSKGNFVNVYNSGGVKIRKADATIVGKEAHGFVLENTSIGGKTTIYFSGKVNDGLSSLTIGAQYYLSTVAGGIIVSAPNALGNIVQRLGVALSATKLIFSPGEPVEIV